MGIDDEFLRRAAIEVGVTLGRLVQRDHLDIDRIGDVDLAKQDRLHQRAMVLHYRALAGVEAVRLGPAKAEAHAQGALLGRFVFGTRILGDIQTRNADFTPGTDRLRLLGTAGDFDDLTLSATTGGVLIDTGDGTIVLEGLSLSDLGAADFVFI